ncbi:hypothetical protein LJR290_006833 [Variovorax sp. LjRoot290]|uniref:hypothetical protein n=1 Tax=Variovorax sp. LjRoot290 TaxID=3342316 RepID=UPI003ECC1D7A
MFFCSLGVVLGTALGAAAARAEPVHAVITEPLGSERLSEMAPQFKAWRKAGVLTDFKLLKAQADQKEPGFAALAVVELPDEAAFKTWSSQTAPKFGDKLIVRRATRVRHEGQPSKTPASAVHVASFYSTHVSASDYKRYTEHYIAPNMNLQRAAGIMSQYAMYVEREPVAGQTRSLLVMEYADAAAYAHREPIKEVGKQKLLADPEWKRLNDVKETIRSDISSTAAIDVGAAMLAAH